MELRKRALGVALGLVLGLGMMLGTWWLLFFGSEGGIISRASGLFPGYTFSLGGSFLGFIWGFIWGFIAGVLIAWFYDIFSKMFYKEKPKS